MRMHVLIEGELCHLTPRLGFLGEVFTLNDFNFNLCFLHRLKILYHENLPNTMIMTIQSTAYISIALFKFFFFLIFIEYWLCACPCSKHLSYITFFNTKNNSMKLIIIIPILQKKRLSYGISYAPSQSEQQIFISQIHLHKFVNQMSLLGP